MPDQKIGVDALSAMKAERDTFALEARQWKEAFDRSCDDISALKAERDELRAEVERLNKIMLSALGKD